MSKRIRIGISPTSNYPNDNKVFYIVTMGIEGEESVSMSIDDARNLAGTLAGMATYAEKCNEHTPSEDIMEILKDCQGVTIEHIARIFNAFNARPGIMAAKDIKENTPHD